VSARPKHFSVKTTFLNLEYLLKHVLIYRPLQDYTSRGNIPLAVSAVCHSRPSKVVLGQHDRVTSRGMKVKMKDRSSGIGCIGSVPWGTHICHFYQSKNDLIDVLVPYFKTGLENNEYCVWATSDPLAAEECLVELGKAVPNLDPYLNRQQITITGAKTFYNRQGKFDAESTLQALVETVEFALKHGFDGLRISGNASWLTKGEWTTFAHYELSADFILRRLKAIGLCSYPLDRCAPSDIVEVVSGHRLVLIRATGGWRLIRNNGNERLASLRNKGLTYQDIGQILGVSRQRIAEILGPNRRTDSVSVKMMRSASPHGLLSSIDAAEFLGVHPNTVRRWSDAGIIPAYRVGKRLDRRFRRIDLQKFLETNR
jgi:excisionase family DNA binding protein